MLLHLRARTTVACMLAALLSMLAACGSTSPSLKKKVPHSASTQGLLNEEQLRINTLYLEAKRHALLEQHDAAYELLSRAHLLNPDAPEVLYELAVLKLSTLSAFDTAAVQTCTEMLEKAVSLAPHHTNYKDTYAFTLLKAGQTEKAITVYEQLLPQRLNDTNFLLRMARLYTDTQHWQKALDMVLRYEQIEDDDSTFVNNKLELYIALQDTNAAVSTARRLAEKYPDSEVFQNLESVVYMNIQQPARALEAIQHTLATHPNHGHALNAQMQIYYQEGQMEAFEQSARRILLNEKVSSSMRALALRFYLGAHHEKEKRTLSDFLPLVNQALAVPQNGNEMAEFVVALGIHEELSSPAFQETLERALAVSPSLIQARLKCVQFAIARDDMEAVYKLCAEGIALQNHSPILYYYKAMSEATLKEEQKALHTLEQGLPWLDEVNDDAFKSDYYAILGDLYQTPKRTQEVIEAYEKALALNPDNLECLNSYAYFLSKTGDQLAYALSMSKRTIDALPETPHFLDTYAWLLFLDKQQAQALIYIDQSLLYYDQAEISAEIYEHAAEIYLANGRKKQARSFFQKALQHHPDAATKARIQKRLKTYR